MAIDFIFFIDIILNFFMGYYDSNEELVDSRPKIIKSYLKTWFIIDIVSIFPISMILNTASYSSLARIARLPKLYRLIRIFK